MVCLVAGRDSAPNRNPRRLGGSDRDWSYCERDQLTQRTRKSAHPNSNVIFIDHSRKHIAAPLSLIFWPLLRAKQTAHAGSPVCPPALKASARVPVKKVRNTVRQSYGKSNAIYQRAVVRGGEWAILAHNWHLLRRCGRRSRRGRARCAGVNRVADRRSSELCLWVWWDRVD